MLNRAYINLTAIRFIHNIRKHKKHEKLTKQKRSRGPLKHEQRLPIRNGMEGKEL